YSFHPEAEEEFNQAIDYYEGIEKGLGYDFAIEVFNAIQRTVQLPNAWAILDDEIRRSLVHRFPYGILYSIEEQGLFIIAIMNLHKDPAYWKNRK
ncbi:MAG: type II toxin-antitoxin system RelE/ParE family toxin, partial [Leptospirales bacterium]